MSIESAADLAVFFNAGEHAKEALYTAPAGGAAVDCTVLVNEADPERAEFDGHAPMNGKVLTVRVSEIAAPAAQGRFAIAGGGPVWTVVGKPWREEPERTLWHCLVV